jgi:DNA polymerase-4
MNFMIHSWPRAILHVDGDAFFASCEQAIHPELKGKPVVTGKERGIISSASYEAKKFGVKRGVTPWDAKKMCPGLIFMNSDYEVYHAFSQRMFAVIRKFTPVVEEYSIDEAFADITGFQRPYHCSYEEIGRRIKAEIEKELDITVSVGVSLSKVLAKVASNFRKPSGLVAIPGREIEVFLEKIPVGKLWGIGAKTAAYAQAHGIFTALDFAQKSEGFIDQYFPKPQKEMWMELRGQSVYPVVDEVKTSYSSISKTRTFPAPTRDRAFIYSQLLKNVENACAKARHYGLVARGCSIFLKSQDFEMHRLDVKFRRATAFTTEVVLEIQRAFAALFQGGALYRTTGITLNDLHTEATMQLSLFEAPAEVEKTRRIYKVVDALTEKMGYPILHLGGSLIARKGLRDQKHEQEPI